MLGLPTFLIFSLKVTKNSKLEFRPIRTVHIALSYQEVNMFFTDATYLLFRLKDHSKRSPDW